MSRARTLADQFNSDGDLALTPVASVNAGQIGGRRNLIINGAMQVAQRGTSSTGVSTGGYYTMDRFKWNQSGSTTWNLSQSTVSPDGFAYSNKIEVNNAVASPSANDYAILSYSFEGQDLQHFDWGTSNAKQITLSFWVRSSITGKFYVELDQSSRWNDVSYTINAADTWEYKTLTFTGDTSVGPDNDNSAELSIYFWFLAGSTYTSGTTTENVWHQTNNADRVVGQTNLAASTGDVIYLTGIQLEVGDQATDFEHRSYGEGLALCQRYYNKASNMWMSGRSYTFSGNDGLVQVFRFPTEMRANPTISFSGGSDGGSSAALYSGGVSTSHVNINLRSTSGSDSQVWYSNFTTTAEAEL